MKPPKQYLVRLQVFSILDIKNVLYFVIIFQAVMQTQPMSSLIGFWKDLTAGCSTSEVLDSTVIEQRARSMAHCPSPHSYVFSA